MQRPSLFRTQNAMHRKVIEAAHRGLDSYTYLPQPFETVIPNATAQASEPDREPASFQAKYTPEFAKLYRSLCDEVVQRTKWEPVEKAEGEPVTA